MRTRLARNSKLTHSHARDATTTGRHALLHAACSCAAVSCALTLKQPDHPFPHAHVHVRLGRLEVVVQVVAEPGQQRHRLLLTAPLYVLREDHCNVTQHNTTQKSDCFRRTARFHRVLLEGGEGSKRISLTTAVAVWFCTANQSLVLVLEKVLHVRQGWCVEKSKTRKLLP